MGMAHEKIRLKAKENAELERLTRKGTCPARVVRRALILLLSDKGWRREQIASATRASIPTVGRVRRAYRERGLERALYEQTRSGRPVVFGDRVRKKVVALACSAPPAGYPRWTCALLAEHYDETPGPSKSAVHLILQEDGIKPWREKNVVRPRVGRSVHGRHGQRPGRV